MRPDKAVAMIGATAMLLGLFKIFS